MSALQRAIQEAGGAKRLADAIGVTVQRLSNWIKRGVPAEHCPDIEMAVNGAVRCEELRPDVRWGVLRGAAAPASPVEASEVPGQERRQEGERRQEERRKDVRRERDRLN